MQAETQHSIDAIEQAILLLKKHVNWQNALDRISQIEESSSSTDFWNDQKNAQELMREKTILEAQIQSIKELNDGLAEQIEMLELAIDEQDGDLIKETENAIQQLAVIASKRQIASLLSGEADKNNCFVEIHSGAGGTEAQDWAAMLLRMYMRWAERRGFKVELIDEADGEEAGIKSATIRIVGDSSYGWIKTESGVHRLVRISPFDSSARRHTSFSSIWVYPEIDDNIEIDIEEKDLRVDTFRASGAGGQHVNVTDSAVRITHLPSKIVVQCQNQRSQHKNKETCYKMLKARMYEHELQKREEKEQKDISSKTDIGWGHQIRSYVLQPYRLVKDLRSKIESTNPDDVLNGNLDQFIEGNLFKS